jgi:predicted MFS family arabinose efflux permease
VPGSSSPVKTQTAETAITPALVAAFAIACGCAVGNLYYAQPLLRIIGREFSIGEAGASAIVTVTQLGYGCGLVLVAPLGDLLENRRLITIVFGCLLLAVLGAATAPNYPAFLAASLMLGLTAVVAQILVPFAAHLAPPDRRGQVVGQVMSGLLTGILIARAASGLISGVVGWRGVYVVSAGVMLAMVFALRRALPVRHPAFRESYAALLRSLAHLLRTEPVLRRRAAYQAAMFGAFSVFWTSITFLLSGEPYHFSQSQIGFFALAGAAGAMFASFAGKLADRGYGWAGTGLGLLSGAAAFGLTLLQNHLWALVAGGILLDLAVNTVMVFGQHAIYSLNPAARSRLNTVFIATFFFGGALSSALAGIAFAYRGWPAVVALGAGLPALAFLFWLTEKRPAR